MRDDPLLYCPSINMPHSNPALSFEGLPTCDPAALIIATKDDLRLIIEGAPSHMKPDGTLTTRNALLGAVLSLRNTLIRSETEASPEESNAAAVEVLLSMEPSEILTIANENTERLVGLMNKALAHDPSLELREFDPLDGGQCAAVALAWKLRATEGILEHREAHGPQRQQERPHATNLFGNLLPDDIPPRAPSTVPEIVLPPKKKAKVMIGGVPVGRGLSRVSEEDSVFRSGLGSSSSVLPSQLGEYPGRSSSLLLLRVSDIQGPSILANLVQRGVNVELAVKNMNWGKTADGEPFQAEAEALTLARIIHLNLLVHPTMTSAIEECPWMETALRRLYAILYVEDRKDIQRQVAWKIAGTSLEVYPESRLRVPTLDGSIAREAYIRVRERNALKGQSNRGGGKDQ